MECCRPGGYHEIYTKSRKDKNMHPGILYPERLSFGIGDKWISQTSKNKPQKKKNAVTLNLAKKKYWNFFL